MRRGILIGLMALLLTPAGIGWAQDDDGDMMPMPTVGGDIMVRTIYKSPFDYFTNDGGDPTGDDGTFMRTRVNFSWDLANNVGVHLQVQDSRVWGVDSIFDGADPDTDFKQAYVSLNNLQELSFMEWVGDNDVDLHIGRIELPTLGDGYLVSNNEWFYTGPTAWDGFMINSEFGGEELAFDVHMLWADLANTDPEFGGAVGPAEGATFWAIQAGTDDLDFVGGEVYFHYYNANIPGIGFVDADLNTYGIRVFSNFSEDSGLDNLEIVAEYAMQDGETATVDIDADFMMVRANYAIDVEGLNPEIGVGISIASGDDNVAAGDAESWISPLEENHNILGHYDLFSNSNIQDIFVLTQITLVDAFDVHLDFHMFTMDEEDGGIFSYYAGFQPSAVGNDDELGTEIDLYATWDCGESLLFQAGWSIFSAGDAIDDATGGFDDGGNFFYLQLTVPFGQQDG